jgi:3-oxoacyl-[acyl-carrier protein] reductase
MRETEPAASTAAGTKPATAADRLVSGQATTISLALRSLTGRALAGIALYSAVKAFLDQVTRVAAVEFAARGITVNAVAPASTVRSGG